jgi:hypothetical protein
MSVTDRNDNLVADSPVSLLSTTLLHTYSLKALLRVRVIYSHSRINVVQSNRLYNLKSLLS